MNDFEKLKTMDLQEVHKKTRITALRLQEIIEKKFSNIDPTRAHGFIKILERELQLDLSEWIQEYDAYRQSLQPKKQAQETKEQIDSNPQIVQPKKEEETPKESVIKITEVTQKPKKPKEIQKPKKSSADIKISMPKEEASKKTFIIAIVGVSIVALLAIGIYFMGDSHVEEKQVVAHNDTQKKAVENDINQTYPTISLAQALQDKEEKREKTSTPDSIKTTEDKKAGTQKEATQSTQTQTDSINPKSEASAKEEVSLTITPKKDVWFAWVDTVTKERGEKYTKTAITLPIKNKTAFHFGYAALRIEVNGEVFDYNQMGVTYMVYDKAEGIKLITQKEYNALRR